MKKLVFVIVLAGFAWLIVECGCFLLLWAAQHYKGLQYIPLSGDTLNRDQAELLRELIEGRTRYAVHDPFLGWKIKPNGTSTLYQANAQGIRGNREYSEVAEVDLIRIATFGDSFTHGDEVPNSSTWQAQWEALDHSYEVLNFGVGGYGPEQAYLRYVYEGKRFHPQIVLIGFMPENIYRSVNVFRPFYTSGTGLVFSKPRYFLQSESLVLLPNPLSSLESYKELLSNSGPVLHELGENDWFYQHRYRRSMLDLLPSVRLVKMLWYEMLVAREFSYRYESEAFRLSLEILTQFYREAERENAMPVIVVFPNKADLEELRADRRPQYASFELALVDRRMKVIDLAWAFQCDGLKDGTHDYFESAGHYSKKANKLVADYLRTLVEAYSRSHEWMQPGEKNVCTVGISAGWFSVVKKPS